MAVQTVVIEVPSSLPATILFKLFKDFDNIAPKAEPQSYKSITNIEGVSHVTYSDESNFNSSKFRCDAMDTDKLTLSYTVIEGDVFMGKIDNIAIHFEFIPSANGGSVYKQTLVFQCTGDSTLSEEELNGAKEFDLNTLKAFEAYAIAHPEVC
uniref:root allergen protein-like n=1 Tax=Erigeron canadensis TaxID=72917 RepID=UPI001CB9984F|nr:root allergen protein-like [Erigeron canadensis]